MKELSLPPYSPGLSPLDSTLWRTIETRARESVGKRTLTVKEYKATLRRTAARLSAKIVGKGVEGMWGRIGRVFHAEGGRSMAPPKP